MTQNANTLLLIDNDSLVSSLGALWLCLFWIQSKSTVDAIKNHPLGNLWKNNQDCVDTHSGNEIIHFCKVDNTSG
jgi:hypothetical protein